MSFQQYSTIYWKEGLLQQRNNRPNKHFLTFYVKFRCYNVINCIIMSERNVKCQRKFLMSCRLKWDGDVYCIYTHSMFLFRQTVPCEPYGLWTIVQFLCRHTPAPQDSRTHTCKTDERRRHQRIRGKSLG